MCHKGVPSVSKIYCPSTRCSSAYTGTNSVLQSFPCSDHCTHLNADHPTDPGQRPCFHPYSRTYGPGCLKSHACPHLAPYSYEHACSNTNGYARTYRHTPANAGSYAHAHPSSYTYTHPRSYTYTHPRSYTYTHAGSDTYAHAGSDTYTHPRSNAHAGSDTYTHPHP